MRRSTLLVLAVAALVRLLAVVWLWDTAPYSDYFYYHEAGRMQAADWRFLFRPETVVQFAKLAWWPPGYPFFLAALYSVFGPHHHAALFAHVVLGTATCALALAIGRRAGNARSGLVAAWILALDPTWVFTTNLVASESLFVPLVALGLWLGGAAQTTRRFAVAGWVLGLAALVRAIGLCLPVALAVWAWRANRRGTGAGRVVGSSRTGRAWAAAVLVGAGIAIAPWTLRNAVVTGTPALVCFGGGLNFYFGHNDGPLGYRPLAQTPLAGLGDAAAIDRRGYELGREMLLREPLGFVTRGVRKVGALFAPPGYALHANTAVEAGPSEIPGAPATPQPPGRRMKERLLHGPLTWLAGIHLYALLAATLAVLAVPARRRRLPAEIQLWAWVWLVWIAAYVIFWAQPRFRHPLDLPMALVAACGLLAPRAAATAAEGGRGRRRNPVSGSRPAPAGRRG